MKDNISYPYGKYVLLTGGSSGIGLACAELMAQNGYIVYSASRNPNLDVKVFDGGGEIRPVKMDVSDSRSVEAVSQSIFAQADIGIVVHSAGVGVACPAEYFPSESIRRLMDTNFMGIMSLNSQVLPHFRKRGTGLCVMISSVAALFPIPFQSHYCSSKSALEAYAGALRMELYDYGIKVCLVLPGDTNTAFTGARSYEIDKTSPYYDACVKAVSKMEKDELAGRPPTSVADVVYRLCKKKNPPLRTVVGLDYKLLAFMRRLLPARFIEYLLRKMYLG